MEITKKCLLFLVTIVVSLTFFFVLFQCDNKYTHQSVQPINGHMILSEKNLQNGNYGFLVNGWEFYPERLLSPTDYAQGEPDFYKTFVSIGETTRFSPANNDTPHGCGTYVLHLHLPERFDTYAIMIPEIFSAYRMYINENEVMTLGTPEKEHYADQTAARIITFDHKGNDEVRIMIAASNYSYLYGGMIYPPTLGSPESLNYIRGIRVILAVIMNLIMGITILLSFYFAFRLKNKTALLFALLCIFAITFMMYPITHMVLVLPIFPYYALELASGYFSMMMIVILYNRICEVNRKLAWTTALISAVFCVGVSVYGLFAAYVNATIADFFSAAAFIYKLLAAAYIILSFHGAAGAYHHYRSIYYATVFFACACVADRIMPLYEPIFGMWFTEWGIIGIVFAIGLEYVRDMVRRFAYHLEFQEEHRQAIRQLKMQVEYADQIKEQTNNNRKLIHDFRQHLRVIRSMAEHSHNSQIVDYLDQISNIHSSGKLPNINFCDNTALDALLRYYAGAMQNEDIEVKFRLSMDEQLPIGEVEFCTVLGNLLENAMEACKKVDKEQRKILLTCNKQGRNLFIVIKNTYNGKIKRIGKRFLSTKTETQRYGIGIVSSEQIIHNHRGTLTVHFDEATFQIGIMLPYEHP